MDNKIVGMVGLRYTQDDRVADIGRLGVSYRFRGKGIAQKLL